MCKVGILYSRKTEANLECCLICMRCGYKYSVGGTNDKQNKETR